MAYNPEVRYTDREGNGLRVVSIGDKVLFSYIPCNGDIDKPQSEFVMNADQWNDLKSFLNAE